MSDDEQSENGEYVVEEIVEKEFRKGTLHYLVQWQGFSAEERTWEPAAHMNCPEKIYEFEEKRRAAERENLRNKADESDSVTSSPKKKPLPTLSGHCDNFESGLMPSTFTGIIRIDGVLHAVVKFKDMDATELVSIAELKKKWPQILIHFLEKKLVYQEEEDGDEGDDDVESFNGSVDGDQNSSSSNCGSEDDEPPERITASPIAGPSGIKKRKLTHGSDDEFDLPAAVTVSDSDDD